MSDTETREIVHIGVECFAATDGSVLCWRGVNYVPQGGPVVHDAAPGEDCLGSPGCRACLARDLAAARAETARLRGVVEAVRALADHEPLIVSGIRGDVARVPAGRGGELRHTPATSGWGASGCPGDNLLDWFDRFWAILASVPSSGEGEPTPIGQEEAASREFGPCGGCGATWPSLHVYSNGPGGVLCVKCGWSPRKGRPDTTPPSSGETGEREEPHEYQEPAPSVPHHFCAVCLMAEDDERANHIDAPASPEPTGADEGQALTPDVVSAVLEAYYPDGAAHWLAHWAAGTGNRARMVAGVLAEWSGEPAAPGELAARPVLSREALYARIEEHLRDASLMDDPCWQRKPEWTTWGSWARLRADHLAAVLDTQEAGDRG